MPADPDPAAGPEPAARPEQPAGPDPAADPDPDPDPDPEPATRAPHRIRVIGASGSGKTTLAREAARRLGVAHLELDGVFWDRDWVFRDLDEARVAVREFVEAHPSGWVADGNWTSRLGDLMDLDAGRSDLVVWLDPPRWRVMARVVRRTLWRGISRRELWHGNRERPSTWFSRAPEKNIVLFAWTQVPTLRERLGHRVGEPGFVRLGSQREVRAWLASLVPIVGQGEYRIHPPTG